MATIKATIFFDKRFWIGTFERTDKKRYAIVLCDIKNSGDQKCMH
jgi:hypothetical protein